MVKFKWIGLVLVTPKTCDNHGQSDKQTEFIIRVKRVQISKIGQVLFLPYLSFETKKKKNLVTSKALGLTIS